MPITTVLGDVPAHALGPTDCHEHLFINGGLPIVLEPDFKLNSVDAARQEVEDFRDAGGAALVDCMPLGVGRDIESLVQVSIATDVRILAATGFHKERYYTADHWIHTYDVDQITELLIAEFQHGIERTGYGGPIVERVSARPGVIKVATTSPGPTQTERTLLAAVAAAAVSTGLPVITHTDSLQCADSQLQALAAHGVPPERVVLSHMDRHGTADELAAVCASGATVCLDWLGRTDRRPDSYVAELACGLVERGHLERVVFGQDLARRQYWRAYGGGPGLRNLFTSLVPSLRELGLSEHHVQTMLVGNPRRVLNRKE